MSVDLVSVALVLVGLLSGLVAWLAYRETHRDNATKAADDRIRGIVRDEVAGMMKQQMELSTRFDNIIHRDNQQLASIKVNTERIGTILDRLMRLETQTEVFWKSVGIDMTKILHQPDPRRHHIDGLLESLQEEFLHGGEHLTADERIELRKLLVKIRNWEPGDDPGFPVRDGEQGVAAILLAIMEHIQ